MIKKPMLAEKITDIKALKYPLYASPKFDGIRALVINGELLSRKFKPIPNKYVRSLAKGLPDGYDGELLLQTEEGWASFNETSSAVMSEDGEPNVKYLVFDYVKDSISKPAKDRIEDLKDSWDDLNSFALRVVQRIISDEEELLEYETQCLEAGLEGVIVRAMNSPYKEGRSTEREGYLLKLKRFEDSEARIVGFEEKQHNTNTKETDAFGYAKRSSAKAGMVGMNTLGKLYAIDPNFTEQVEIGTGFDDALRKEIWEHQDKYLNRLVKYKHQKCGQVDKPRFPVFLGFRDERDL